MKVDQKAEKNPCVVSLTVKADADEIKGAVKKVLNEFVREAQIQGACFREFYPKAVEESKLKVIALEGVAEMKLSEADGMEFTALVEVRPEYKMPKYKGLSIDSKDVKVEDAAVEAQLESLRKMFAKFEDAKEGDIVGDGDFVQFDYKGTLDGKPLSEVVPDQKAVCEATGFWMGVSSLRSLRGSRA